MLTEVTVDLRVYSLLTVERAAAALSTQYVIALALHDARVRVSLRPRFDAVPESEVVADFVAQLTELAILEKLAGRRSPAPALQEA